MQQRDLEIYPYQKDEIDLRGIILSLVARKFIILGLTGFITLLGIIFALNITPTYKSTSSFTSPADYSVINVNKLKLTNETKSSIFNAFLTRLSSREFQMEVFIDGDYLSVFNNKNESSKDERIIISKIIESVSVTPPPLTKKDIEFEFLTELPYSVSMEGKNPVVISNYLNELVAAANTKTVDELIKLIKQKVDNRLDQMVIERQFLLTRKKQQRLNEIAILTDAARIAKSLGIIENNFNTVSADKMSSNLVIAIAENQTLPDWYLYGEKALLERVNILKNRTIDDPFIPELLILDSEKQKLDSIEVDKLNFSSMQLSLVAIPPTTPIKPNKRLIVLTSLIIGFAFSIFVALIMNVLEPEKRTLPR